MAMGGRAHARSNTNAVVYLPNSPRDQALFVFRTVLSVPYGYFNRPTLDGITDCHSMGHFTQHMSVRRNSNGFWT